jgi:hypothetical protein
MRRRSVAVSARPPLVWSLGLLAGTVAVLLLPAFAFAFLSADTGACLCQSLQSPGDYFTVVACLDVAHGWLACGATPLTTACGLGAVSTGAQAPRGRSWTAASVGRPPPLSA